MKKTIYTVKINGKIFMKTVSQDLAQRTARSAEKDYHMAATIEESQEERNDEHLLWDVNFEVAEEVTRGSWKEGEFGIPTEEGIKTAHYWAKVYDTGSEYGIDGGRISKLRIDIDKLPVVNYDRGWDIEPETKEAKLALQLCMEKYK